MQQHMNDLFQSHPQAQPRTSAVQWSPNTDNSPSSSSSLPLSPSPLHRFHESMTALDLLNLLWGDDLFAHLAQHTNLYAQHKQQQEQKQDNNWWVTADEMRTLFGMFVYMSIVKLHPWRIIGQLILISLHQSYTMSCHGDVQSSYCVIFMPTTASTTINKNQYVIHFTNLNPSSLISLAHLPPHFNVDKNNVSMS